MKTILEMAREAGLHRQQHNLMSSPVQHRFSYAGYEENLERFAELVRADNRNRWEHNYEVLMNALWKACGDDAKMVEATIKSQGELK